MTRKIWYEIWGEGPAGWGTKLLVKVHSQGLATLILSLLKPYYTNLIIK